MVICLYECLYEFNLLHYVGVVVKRLRAAAVTAAVHEGTTKISVIQGIKR